MAVKALTFEGRGQALGGLASLIHFLLSSTNSLFLSARVRCTTTENSERRSLMHNRAGRKCGLICHSLLDWKGKKEKIDDKKVNVMIRTKLMGISCSSRRCLVLTSSIQDSRTLILLIKPGG